jgi:hypothetical protein
MPILLTLFGAQFAPVSGWRSFVIKPLDLQEDQPIKFTYQAVSRPNKKTFIIQIYLKNAKYPERILSFYEIVETESFVEQITRVFVFPKGAMTAGVNELSFTCTHDGVSQTIVAEAYPKTRALIEPHIEDGQSIYASPFNYLELSDGILEKKRDYIEFIGYKNVIDDEYYHRLNLSSLSFFYRGQEFVYQKALFLIHNRGDYYSHLEESDIPGYRQIPLHLMRSDDEYSFAFLSPLYVEPSTLLMSLSPADGFIPTNYFYFPREKYTSERDVRMQIIVTSCGINECQISYKFTYFSYLKLIGDCRDSKYCISTSLTNVDDDLTDWNRFTYD